METVSPLMASRTSIVSRSPPPADATAPTHLLVLARDLDDPDRYGLPVDRVHGLVDGPVPPAAEDGVIAERRPVEGRLMNVLDAKRLLERAVSVIEQSMTAGGRNNGGES